MAYIPINTSVRSRTELSRLWNKGSGKLALTYCQGDLDPQGLGGGSGSVVCALTGFTVSHILFITYYSLFLKPFLLNLKQSEEKWNAWKTKGLVQGGADSTPQQEVEAECPYACGHAEPTLSFCSHSLKKMGEHSLCPQWCWYTEDALSWKGAWTPVNSFRHPSMFFWCCVGK